MATLDQLYRAYLSGDPNVDKMVYDPFGWNYEQTFDTTEEGTDTDTGIGAVVSPTTTGGDNYSVYNPDPNRTTLPTSYRPYSARKAHEYSFINPYRAEGEFGYDTETEMQKHMDMYPGYYNPKTNQYTQFAKSLVPMWMKAGIAAAKDMLPINPGGIMKNEMLGQGFAVDDIGRVVMQQTGWTTGPDGERTWGAIDATDPRNVMAGYNLTNISEEDIESGNNPFDKRIEKIRGRDIDEALKTKYIDAIEAAKQNWLNAQTNQLAIIKWKQKQKQQKKLDRATDDQKTTIEDFKTKENILEDDPSLHTVTTPKDDIIVPKAKPKVIAKHSPHQHHHDDRGGGGVSTAGQATGVSRSAPQRDYSSHHAYGLNRGGIVDLL